MALKALVCERWSIEAGLPGDPKDQWFLNWVMRKPHESSAHITAGYAAIAELADYLTEPAEVVTECFGGLGCWGLVVQDKLKPQQHTIMDYQSDAVRHLKNVFADYPGVTVMQGDAYDADVAADVVVLDCGDMTIHRAISYPPLVGLLDRTFAAHPSGVLLTDIAGGRLPLHRDRYALELDHDASTYPAYLQGLGLYLSRKYGYHVLNCFYQRWSAVMVLVPGEGAPTLTPVPARPIGVHIVEEER